MRRRSKRHNDHEVRYWCGILPRFRVSYHDRARFTDRWPPPANAKKRRQLFLALDFLFFRTTVLDDASVYALAWTKKIYPANPRLGS